MNKSGHADQNYQHRHPCAKDPKSTVQSDVMPRNQQRLYQKQRDPCRHHESVSVHEQCQIRVVMQEAQRVERYKSCKHRHCDIDCRDSEKSMLGLVYRGCIHIREARREFSQGVDGEFQASMLA